VKRRNIAQRTRLHFFSFYAGSGRRPQLAALRDGLPHFVAALRRPALQHHLTVACPHFIEPGGKRFGHLLTDAQIQALRERDVCAR